MTGLGPDPTRHDLVEQGVLVCDISAARREHPHLVEEHFAEEHFSEEHVATVVPPDGHTFDTSVWSGGSFVYVPPGVEVAIPLQSLLRTTSKSGGEGDGESGGRFERTLIIADEGSTIHYIDGCSAPVYTRVALYRAAVEVVVKPHARVTHTTIQNWSTNVDNLVIQRARVEAHGRMEWIDVNFGSNSTVSHPTVHLVGEGATGEVRSVASAGRGQHQATGAEMVHAAPNTTSTIVSKSISKDGGVTTSRGLVRIDDGVTGAVSHVERDALILDEDSISETLPFTDVGERDARVGHQTTVSRITEAQLFYLMSRGLSEGQAMGVIVNGFVEPVMRMLPMEYAVELARLIELQMLGSVG